MIEFRWHEGVQQYRTWDVLVLGKFGVNGPRVQRRIEIKPRLLGK